MHILGVDPGKSGGAVLMDKYGDILELEGFRPDAQNNFDLDGFSEMILTWKQKYSPFIAFVEKVHAMPKQGVVSMFSFGKTYGMILGVLHAYDIDVTDVTPSQWTRKMHQPETRHMMSKERSVAVAMELWPGLDLRISKRARKPHDGIVDALLIAEYARKNLHESPVL